ncbi:hypothetical protein AB9E53_02635 [Escherichia coli]|uniref:Exported protein n=1 Tax=Citrobacter rodentium (strain ICC168) TaxID=637910 RepID=D2TV49_CITRI|nr:hypothetical protein [Citrobacter rodentium]EGI3993574.1 hypothetical protein [Escherichia coli]EGI4003409.1 hypothetical protein [Escherichia coli]EGI4008680.1 hypothetical protein [Escherichia coli]EGI4023179.1 hypothetical protein [Escherichia coli]EGI4028317.1 hypothetical protein [Escherichia coli]
MKHIFNKNVLAVMGLISAGVPFTALAVSSATVNIKAIVPATVSISVDSEFILKNLTAGDDLNIKTATNGSKTRLTMEVSPDQHEGNDLVLKNGQNKMKLTATLAGKPLTINNNKASVEILGTGEQTTKLHLTPEAGATSLFAGQYQGNIKLIAEPV